MLLYSPIKNLFAEMIHSLKLETLLLETFISYFKISISFSSFSLSSYLLIKSFLNFQLFH
jgi:hypothetical protein